ncbi:unnamed protein product [Phyllotreta striolata]|uniref:Cytochrome P450 monooxygenase n=1 Tax=Phyllotreta striolata TaxID=444603 RepID=A0A9N9TUC8_PHYSR|nr:unnamed protein product [Phyllotreta striolata]
MLAVLVALLASLAIYLYWKNRNLPPGPWGLPILGYLTWLDPLNPYVTLTKLSKKYGSVYSLSLGNVFTVVLTDPKILKSLFAKDSTTGRAPLYLTHGIMRGYGLICAEGDLWKEHRKFTHNCLRQFGATKIGPQRKKMEALILEHCFDLTNYLKKIDGKTAVDILPGLRHSLGSAVNQLVFGKSWERDDETWLWLQHLQEEGPKYLGVAGPLNFLPFFRFLPKYKKIIDFILTGITNTHKEYSKIIKEQSIQQVDDSNIIQAFLTEKRKKPPLVAEKLYNDTQLHFLLGDLFGASLDTTLTTLRWYFLYLSKYPSIQSEIREELEAVLEGRSPTMDDLDALPLTEASILECMRIRPVVPVGIPHGALEDIEVLGYKIPKGSMIVPLQWAMHMDETVWKRPDQFDPRRFINEDGKIEKPEHFVPFQVGKRMCVGHELATMFVFLFAVTLLQNFSFTIADKNVDLWGECGITLTPKHHKFLLKEL